MKIRKNEKSKNSKKTKKKLNLGHKVAPRPSGVLLVIEILIVIVIVIASGEWWVASGDWKVEKRVGG